MNEDEKVPTNDDVEELKKEIQKSENDSGFFLGMTTAFAISSLYAAFAASPSHFVVSSVAAFLSFLGVSIHLSWKSQKASERLAAKIEELNKKHDEEQTALEFQEAQEVSVDQLAEEIARLEEEPG